MNDKVRAQLSVMGRFEITLDNQVVSYTLKRSTKAKLIWLDIKRQTGLTVTLPSFYNIKYLQEYLEINAAWIIRNLARYCSEIPAIPELCPRTANTISYLGKSFKVMQIKTCQGAPSVKLEQNQLTVNLRPSDKNLSAPELEQWLKTQASLLINSKVNQFSTRIGVLYNRITIRDQRSRWGSCSCRKNLNFNWRLIMAPEPVLDYVIIHELCHLKEMSHSKKFWTLVSKHCPDWHERRNWLDDHCIELNARLQI
jgi:predicted metal-dependent hydrolase